MADKNSEETYSDGRNAETRGQSFEDDADDPNYGDPNYGDTITVTVF
jgi:hypothetical protein